MLKNLSYLTLSFIYINLLGYIYHFYVSRKLGVVGYGEFMVLYSLLITIGNFSNSFGTVTLKCTLENYENKFEVLRFLRIIALLIGTCIFFLLFFLSDIIINLLNITNFIYLLIISIGVPFIFLMAVEKGFLQATDKFGIFSLATSAELTIRFLFTVIALFLGYYIGGVLLASIAGILSVFICILFYNGKLFGKWKKIPLKKIIMITLYSLPLGFLTYVDNLFVKRYFSAETAGKFASVSVLGKALIMLSLTLFTVFFQRMVGNLENKQKFFRFAVGSLFFICGIYLFSELGIILFGKKVFYLLFGEKFLGAFTYLPYYVLATLPMCLNLIFIGIFTSIERHLSIIYLNILSYIVGFFCFGFKNLNSYFLYIFSLHLIFFMIYLWLFLRIKYGSKELAT